MLDMFYSVLYQYTIMLWLYHLYFCYIYLQLIKQEKYPSPSLRPRHHQNLNYVTFDQETAYKCYFLDKYLLNYILLQEISKIGALTLQIYGNSVGSIR